MFAASNFAPTAPQKAYSDTWGGRRLREMDEMVESAMARALNNDVITDNQRATAWEKFYQADWSQQLAWSSRIEVYVREVLAGKRQPRPEVAPAVAEEVQQLEAAAQQVQQQVEQHAQQVEEVMEQVAEVVATAVAARDNVEVPMWVARANREELPAGLKWSGRQLPAVGGSVNVMR
jgi:methyl-accepting chemotaxis protein